MKNPRRRYISLSEQENYEVENTVRGRILWAVSVAVFGALCIVAAATMVGICIAVWKYVLGA